MSGEHQAGTGAGAEPATLGVDIWRGRADGRFERFVVPALKNQTVLDVVTYVQRHLDASLAYRFACRVGMCGSCAMTVNGRPRWTCRSHVEVAARAGRLEIAPLANLPVIRDLVVDMAPFFAKWGAARGRFVPPRAGSDAITRIDPRSSERLAASAAIECINCAVCHSACDVVRWRTDYLGPAALNRAWAAWNDVRDGDRAGVLEAVGGPAGCHNCHTHQSCAAHCPLGLDPTRSIAGLKRTSVDAGRSGARS